MATIVLYPSPGMGHLISMVELGKHISKHHPSFSIVVLTLIPSFNTGTTATYVRQISATFPAITFHHLPDIPLDPLLFPSMEAIIFELIRRSNPNVDRALQSISSSSKITAFVIDTFCAPAMSLAENINVPLKEIAKGLEMSGVRFLWVVRSPPSNKKEDRFLPPPEPDLDILLPEGFLERTKDRGLVVKKWAPQVAVLNHKSVGGFVTHCGWNSVLEAVCAGVPMVAWPLYAEQKFNKVVLRDEMKLVLPMDESEGGLVTAMELEKRVRQLMEGKVVREVAKARKEEAAMALSDGGSSRVSLSKLVASW
ncbi:putative UDP-glucuronosyl/UDP-glucosyltransferase, UDP-glycosyltransferase family [Helianthus annuus]|nr:putative UDP-glucuronosyl/UDP-glucosyltransferase, UDP-glycosyltransferase family [Helianthus annuus]KAJ0542142.1 putative UDP-glucuronosyl/UDP-glucosyltransferase, UDP-glycosyltransferase family [Helianthus annuus]KAJ0707201.1 putative UDP-glucuronosyl/UDP-glucosyltransferase, UDP-glycosyltransferase family [Helianthus annuus]